MSSAMPHTSTGVRARLPRTVEELHTLIVAEQPNLSARLKLVAIYLVEHPQQIAFNTLAEIAEKAGVHASTLVRFANYFGFDGFSELQRLYKNQIIDHPSNYRERISQLKKAAGGNGEVSPALLLHDFAEGNILALGLLQQQIKPEVLNSAVQLLTQANEVFICGVRRMFPAAVYMNYALSQMDVRCHLIDGQGAMAPEQMKWITAESVLVAITFNPYGQTTTEAVQFAREKGAKVVLITDSELCPHTQHADAVLIVREADVRGFRSLNSTLCLVQTLCVALGYQG
ncbi:MurR/RpiR family transcriptional regulator [Thiolinea disciformis]|uniref:MurR/RpiR family transcriptional regulator n=1 Tax=Thiolinea disciformis TaxID=125614 RepID=UPI0014615BB5|nr:MurR/RpiR family transcriptional regulator [Thiolinea disciformis]